MTAGHSTLRDSAQGNAGWLVSMADLVSILLCFFIMMFSMSSVDTEKWRGLAIANTTDRLPVVDQPASEPAATKPLIPRASSENAADLGYLAAVIADKLASDPTLRGALLARSEDGLVIALPSQLLFTAGSAALAHPARDSLVRLSGMLRTLDNRVEVRGHGDPTPVRDGIFASNWELALARAAAVAAVIQQAGYSRPITAFGQAKASHDFIAAGHGEAASEDFARRIDIVIRPSATEAAP
jgi:chemotaxis protein MotB